MDEEYSEFSFLDHMEYDDPGSRETERAALELEEYAGEISEDTQMSGLDEMLAQGDMYMDIPEDVEDTPKVYERDADLLREQGERNIQSILDVLEDDYRDKGYDANEISSMLRQERERLVEEFNYDLRGGWI